MTAPNVLINEGWTRTALKIGDKVTMYVNPLRNKSCSTTAARARCTSASSSRTATSSAGPTARAPARAAERPRREPGAQARECCRRRSRCIAARERALTRSCARASCVPQLWPAAELQPAPRVFGGRAGAAQMHHRRERLLLLERRAQAGYRPRMSATPRSR